ncbi:MAG: PKD domain-containing protein [Candidatus Bipolaricaulaceae bacterium]
MDFRRTVGIFGLAGCGLLVGCCWFVGNPMVSFTYTPPAPQVGDVVIFTAQQTGGARIVSWEWQFGDGATGSGQVVAHRYDEARSYTVTLIVTDECGKKGTCSSTILVTGRTGAVCSNLSGVWHGSITSNYWYPNTYTLVLHLNHQGETVSGTAHVGVRTSPGIGSMVGGRFQFTFVWPDYPSVQVTLVGRCDSTIGELYGDWYVGGQVYGQWRVRR